MQSGNKMGFGIVEEETSVKFTIMSRWHVFMLVTMYPCRLSSKAFSFLIGNNGIKYSSTLLHSSLNQTQISNDVGNVSMSCS